MALVMLAGVLGLPASAEESRLPALAAPGQQTLENFRPYQGQVFRVYGGPGARQVERLELVELKDLGSTDQVQQFVLTFRGPHDSTLQKDVYFFEHPQAGKLKLWLEPAGSDDQGSLFESHFNLLLGKP